MSNPLKTELSAAQMKANHRAVLFAAPMVARCAFCRWQAEGEAGDLLQRARRHRERRHGILKAQSLRSSKHLSTFRQAFLTDEDRAEIETEVARRRRLHGLEDAA